MNVYFLALSWQEVIISVLRIKSIIICIKSLVREKVWE